MLIAVFPAGKVADYFILAVRKLSANFFQCVPLKVKLTSRIRRFWFRFFIFSQCAKGPLLWGFIAVFLLKMVSRVTFEALSEMSSMRHLLVSFAFRTIILLHKISVSLEL
jgi:hypothetical protein